MQVEVVESLKKKPNRNRLKTELKPIRKPIIASLAAITANTHQIGSPAGMASCMKGTARTAKPNVAARRATPGIMLSVSAGQMANAPPILAIARTAASIQRWNSTYGTI